MNYVCVADVSKKEFKDWKDIQSRTHKRVWTRIAHPNSHKERLGAREEKEERECVDALAKEQGSKARIEALETQVAELAQQVTDLEPYAREHDKLSRQLEQLYHRVFDGPTPGYPEEDAAERAYTNAGEHFNSVREPEREIAADASSRARLRTRSARRSCSVPRCSA